MGEARRQGEAAGPARTSSGLPTGEDLRGRAARRGGGWGLTRADVLFAGATLLVAGGVAARQWLGLGRGGAAGAGGAATGAAADSMSGDGVDGVAGTGAASGSTSASASASSSLYAVVQNTEGFRQTLPLGQDASVTVEGSRGTNVIEVAGGRVRVAWSDCANQICVDTGWVGAEGQTITCLPHQLVVQVVASPEDATPLA